MFGGNCDSQAHWLNVSLLELRHLLIFFPAGVLTSTLEAHYFMELKHLMPQKVT